MPPARRVVGGSFRIPRSVLPATGRGKARLATQKSPRSGAFKEGALRGPAQPPSLHANTQRQGPMVFWIQKVRSGSKTYLLNPKQKLLDSKATLGNRTKNRTSNRGAHAQECCTQCSTTCLSRRMPNAPCPYALSILPSSKMRRALLAVGSETGNRAREQVQRVAADGISQTHRSSVAR